MSHFSKHILFFSISFDILFGLVGVRADVECIRLMSLEVILAERSVCFRRYVRTFFKALVKRFRLHIDTRSIRTHGLIIATVDTSYFFPHLAPTQLSNKNKSWPICCSRPCQITFFLPISIDCSCWYGNDSFWGWRLIILIYKRQRAYNNCCDDSS